MGLFKKHKTKYALTKIVNNPVYKLDSLYAAQQMDLTPIENKIGELENLINNSIQTINNNFGEVNKLITKNAGEIDKLKNKEDKINNIYSLRTQRESGTTVWNVKRLDNNLYAYYLDSDYVLGLDHYNPFFKQGKEYIINIYLVSIIKEIKQNQEIIINLENVYPLRPITVTCTKNGIIDPPEYKIKKEFVMLTKQNIFNIAGSTPIGSTTSEHSIGFYTFLQFTESKKYKYE